MIEYVNAAGDTTTEHPTLIEDPPEKMDGTSDEFGTPEYIFKPLHDEFHFTLDAAASYKNAKISRYIPKEQNALAQDWLTFGCVPEEYNTAVWCNPPYSRGNVPAFVQKAYDESRKGLVVALLIPARTEQDWFHDIVLKHAEVRFIRRRIKFIGGATSARQTHMVVIFPKKRGERVKVDMSTMRVIERCTP